MNLHVCVLCLLIRKSYIDGPATCVYISLPSSINIISHHRDTTTLVPEREMPRSIFNITAEREREREKESRVFAHCVMYVLQRTSPSLLIYKAFFLIIFSLSLFRIFHSRDKRKFTRFLFFFIFLLHPLP